MGEPVRPPWVERIPNDLMAEYYVQRASAGLIITEATTISAQANGWNESPGIYSDAMTEGWRGVVDSVHGSGRDDRNRPARRSFVRAAGARIAA